jgi:hypothetical protein
MVTIQITNDETGVEPIGNYDYSIRVNGALVHHGRVIGHDRRNGLRVLLRLVAADGETDEEKTKWHMMGSKE